MELAFTSELVIIFSESCVPVPLVISLSIGCVIFFRAELLIWIFESWDLHMWIFWEMSVANAKFMTAEIFECEIYDIVSVSFVVALKIIAKVNFTI